MEMTGLQELAQSLIEWGAILVALLLGLGVISILVMFLIDKTQTRHAIRRNYPVVGRFRYLFEHMGEFFRQYFFAMDREELPFNRAERSWVYRAAKEVDNTVAFGSTRQLNIKGDVFFLNSAFPTLDEDAVQPRPVTIGGGSCSRPYTNSSILNISAMSFGAISEPAVRALARGAKDAGIWMNTGEGGLSPYHLESGADLVFQIGTAKYGVRDGFGLLSDDRLLAVAAHEQVRMFEIKMSQGAKPGKGGILPGDKVTEEVARIRGIEPGVDSISPNGHPDIRCADDLLDMVERIRQLTGKPVGFKMVVGQLDFFHDLFRAIHSRGPEFAPDFITIDSADGGTGAAPQPLIDYMGMPLQESLPLVVDLLQEYGLRERIKVIASGKLIAPARVAWALAMGADFCVSARGFMFALGCVQSLQCNRNTCPTGITTHDEDLQRGLVPAEKSIRVAAYARQMAYGVGIIAHSCGVTEPRGMQRGHVRIIESTGASRSMAELHPLPAVKAEYAGVADALSRSQTG
ncbi:FMN-binding glutamate synthase family protein [Pseudohalioglobus lutimaris]|uniref:FMN-binding glutamate synthase family protein n=1 Tax=Pseudohalioglobus lutimaris TaxID=1737061 RepID=A0A2N5X7B3_9GAMM|nr:FMN-binding glutamate synthase family protein [Pseudohalioglobus lutimaris]PLW70369.1 FMN-binding glutamate synthase family protein [Pseudohalioglobus lutimaris]